MVPTEVDMVVLAVSDCLWLLVMKVTVKSIMVQLVVTEIDED